MAAPEPLVAVLVGTDHHPFERLVVWVSALAETGDARWFVQHGTTELPEGLDGSPMLAPVPLKELLILADAVVCHAEPDLIIEARAVGHVPVVVARDPMLGEHVGDHQQRFLGHLGRRDLVVPATTLAELDAAVGQTLAGSRGRAAGSATDAAAVRFAGLVRSLLRRP